MAAGLPIITFADLEGVMDIYNPDCIELIPDRNVESVIVAIKHAIERRWNKEKIVEHGNSWNWNNVCEAYRNIYVGLIDNRRQ
jgi:glycosyltransferase involved in cell wall biosynthesis